MKKTYKHYGISSKETIYMLLESQKEDGEEGTEKLKKKLLRASQSWGKIWTSKFMNLGSQKYSTQMIFSKTHYNKTGKNQ